MGTPERGLGSAVRSKVPATRLTRYDTCGLSCSQCQVSRPFATACATSLPLPLALTPAGTSITSSVVMRSLGKSWHGNQNLFDSGCPCVWTSAG